MLRHSPRSRPQPLRVHCPTLRRATLAPTLLLPRRTCGDRCSAAIVQGTGQTASSSSIFEEPYAGGSVSDQIRHARCRPFRAHRRGQPVCGRSFGCFRAGARHWTNVAVACRFSANEEATQEICLYLDINQQNPHRKPSPGRRLWGTGQPQSAISLPSISAGRKPNELYVLAVSRRSGRTVSGRAYTAQIVVRRLPETPVTSRNFAMETVPKSINDNHTSCSAIPRACHPRSSVRNSSLMSGGRAGAPPVRVCIWRPVDCAPTR